MAVKTDEIISVNGLVTSPVRELMTGGHPWDVDKVYQKDTLITINDSSFNGELSHKQFFSLTDNNIGNNPLTDTVNWVEDNVVKYLKTDATITVGAAGEFARLDMALLYLGRYVAVDDASIVVNILSGHIIDYPISITGLNLGYITITSDDVEVIIRGSGIDSATNTIIEFHSTVAPLLNFSMSTDGPGNGHPGFAIVGYFDGSTGQIIGSNLTANHVGYIRVITAHQGSSIIIKSCIVTGGRIGVNLSSASDGAFYDTDFSSQSSICLSSGGIGSFIDGCNFSAPHAIIGVSSTHGSNTVVLNSNCRITGASVANDLSVGHGGIIVKGAGTLGGTNIATERITVKGIIYNAGGAGAGAP